MNSRSAMESYLTGDMEAGLRDSPMVISIESYIPIEQLRLEDVPGRVWSFLYTLENGERTISFREYIDMAVDASHLGFVTLTLETDYHLTSKQSHREMGARDAYQLFDQLAASSPRLVACLTNSGREALRSCIRCGGSGYVMTWYRNAYATSPYVDCPDCGGSGERRR